MPEYPETSTNSGVPPLITRSKAASKAVDFGFSSVEFLWNQQPVWRVMFPKRKFVDALLGFPFSKTAPQITLEASRSLIALLRHLGEQLHDDCRHRARNALQPLARRHRLSCNVAVHPFHRISSREGETSGQHFVQRHTQGIEVASRIDRAIHSPGLFWGHVSE